ncbi:MAG: heavy metal-binding domain-containing protein [Candidatus Pacebacteria bacterium]|jgi:uncharacterized protein YbjQ (UPF0145 family)|nr:heavy metal-binding domain-containing protein [Candidatus Paceibacterota bacterium]
MIITTTPSVEGKKITNYLGLVHGDTILGANIVRDFFAGITDIIGGRSMAYEEELIKAKNISLEEMKKQAEKLGAHAIVGIDFDYETVGARGGMLMVNVSGTAVTLE